MSENSPIGAWREGERVGERFCHFAEDVPLLWDWVDVAIGRGVGNKGVDLGVDASRARARKRALARLLRNSRHTLSPLTVEH